MRRFTSQGSPPTLRRHVATHMMTTPDEVANERWGGGRRRTINHQDDDVLAWDCACGRVGGWIVVGGGA